MYQLQFGIFLWINSKCLGFFISPEAFSMKLKNNLAVQYRHAIVTPTIYRAAGFKNGTSQMPYLVRYHIMPARDIVPRIIIDLLILSAFLFCLRIFSIKPTTHTIKFISKITKAYANRFSSQ